MRPNPLIFAYIAFDTTIAVEAEVKEKVASKFKPIFFETRFGFSSFDYFVVNSTFNGCRFERGRYQFLVIDKHG